MGFFMLNRQTGKHHKIIGDLWRHYDDTCNVHHVDKHPGVRNFFRRLVPPETDRLLVDWPDAEEFHARRPNALRPYRLAPSRNGWVTVCYETECPETTALITFHAQISEKRMAWQRRPWLRGVDFDKNWDDAAAIQKGIEHFLWVAECEEARDLLPKS